MFPYLPYLPPPLIVGVLGAFYRVGLPNAVKHPHIDKTLYTSGSYSGGEPEQASRLLIVTLTVLPFGSPM